MMAAMLSQTCGISGAGTMQMPTAPRASAQPYHANCAPVRLCSRMQLVPRWHGSRPMVQCEAGQQLQQLDRRRQLRRRGATCTYPEPETEKERSSVDFPQEWMTPQPSRRPDPMPDFEKLETPLPRKLPGDPEVPDEDEEEEEEKKKKDPDKDNPDKEKPDAPPSEE